MGLASPIDVHGSIFQNATYFPGVSNCQYWAADWTSGSIGCRRTANTPPDVRPGAAVILILTYVRHSKVNASVTGCQLMLMLTWCPAGVKLTLSGYRH